MGVESVGVVHRIPGGDMNRSRIGYSIARELRPYASLLSRVYLWLRFVWRWPPHTRERPDGVPAVAWWWQNKLTSRQAWTIAKILEPVIRAWREAKKYGAAGAAQ